MAAKTDQPDAPDAPPERVVARDHIVWDGKKPVYFANLPRSHSWIDIAQPGQMVDKDMVPKGDTPAEAAAKKRADAEAKAEAAAAAGGGEGDAS